MILNFNVNQQTIVLMKTSSVPRIGSKEYLALQFSFSSDWENLDKLVYLQSGDVSQPISIVDNLVEVPEWFTEQDSFNVTLFGTDGTTEVPTNVVSVQLEKSNELWQKDAPEPQPSWLVTVLESVEKAKASEDAAKLSETNAASSASSAQESAESASTSALNASTSAAAAVESKTLAIEAKTAAEAAKTDASKSASAAKESETASKASETAAAESATVAQSAQSGAEAAKTAAEQYAQQAAESVAVYDGVVSDVTQLKQDVEHLAPTIVCKSSGYVITLDDSCDRTLSGLNIYGKTTQDGTPSPDAPVPLVSVGNRGAIKTTVCGKNFLSLLNPLRDANTNYCTSLTDNAASISRAMSGKWKATSFWYYIPAGTYTVSAKMYTDKGYMNFALYKCDSLDGEYTHLLNLTADGQKTFVLNTPTYIELRLHWTGETDSNGEIWTTRYYDIMLEKGSTATAYEPYQGNTVTVQTPNGLPGIPVDSGGNYTDASGQQWVCDEVDFGRGVYVQRVYRYAFTGNEELFTYDSGKLVGRAFVTIGLPECKVSVSGSNLNMSPIMSNVAVAKTQNDLLQNGGTGIAVSKWGGKSFFYFASATYGNVDQFKEKAATAYANGTPWEMCYALETPTETPLSDEELSAYAALRTNYPNTTIINDSGAWMGIGYQADTKLYIDKQFTELRNAIVALGGNI